MSVKYGKFEQSIQFDTTEYNEMTEKLYKMQKMPKEKVCCCRTVCIWNLKYLARKAT